MGQHLTIYHIKSEFAEACEDSFEPILSNPEEKGVETIDLAEETPFKAQLFISIPEPNSPSWVDFLKGGFDDIPEALTQSPSAVLAIRIPYEEKEKVFAFTFGHGRYLLNSKSYDQNYGLRVALNAIYEQIEEGNPTNPNRLRSVAARTIAANPIRTRRQVDRKATFETFGVDIQRDLLSAVTGMPMRLGFWGTRISGSDSLSANPDIEFEGLGEYCKRVADTYRKETYKQDFDFIDNLRLITDKTEVEDFETELAKTLKDEPEKISLAVPEIIDFDKIAHFRFLFEENETSKEFVDPDDADLGVLKDKETDSAKLFGNIKEQWRLEAVSGQNEVEYSWPILKCLSLELPYKKKTHILSAGDFFEVSNDYLRNLDNFIRALRDTAPCPPECEGYIPEGKYNSDTADGKSFLCLDKRTVRVQDDQEKTTPIEVCDLFTNKGCFIHVKWKRGSSELSHLFAQGSTSADLFLRSKAYREAALEEIQNAECDLAANTGNPAVEGRFSTFSVNKVNPKNFEVSYAIIAKWNGKKLDALPFFSKVNLRRHVEDLYRMGYKVSVARINVV